MKVALLLSSVSRANGGISESVRALARALHARGDTEVGVLGLEDEFTATDLPLWQPLVPRAFPVRGPRAAGFAPGLLPALAEAAPDVAHAAGLWMCPSVAERRWARAARRPYLVSPHGMLDAWALRNSAWKKRIAAALFERAHLEGAACLHALCAAEAEAIRAYGLRNPICVIPNGVDLPDPASAARTPSWAGRFPADRPVLLFLGRLHPKKGLPELLHTWAGLPRHAWQLVIAGWDQGGHRAELEAFVAARGLADSVTFVGPLHGADKAAAYAAASGFVLPSHSEGLPMTILEAWSHRLPVLMTAACNLPAGFAAGAAREIFADPARMARPLHEFLTADKSERDSIGQRGRALVEKDFLWPRIAERMRAVYHWVAAAGPRPDCVQG